MAGEPDDGTSAGQAEKVEIYLDTFPPEGPDKQIDPDKIWYEPKERLDTPIVRRRNIISKFLQRS